MENYTYFPITLLFIRSFLLFHVCLRRLISICVYIHTEKSDEVKVEYSCDVRLKLQKVDLDNSPSKYHKSIVKAWI